MTAIAPTKKQDAVVVGETTHALIERASVLITQFTVAGGKGLDLPDGLSFDEWAAVGDVLQHLQANNQWKLGDWIAYKDMRGEWTETWAQAVKVTKYSPSALSNAYYTAKAFPDFSREKFDLSFSHFLLVRKLPEVERDEWLQLAVDNTWSKHQLHDAMRDQKALPANNTGDDEWYTPKPYIDAAIHVMGGIDVDPASNKRANDIVGATTFYAEEDDGLTKEWTGRVWMNPPYARKLVDQFAAKLCVSVEEGATTAALVLVNNATETAWFHMLMQTASAVCFPRGRVKFWHPTKETAAPLQGQAVLYFGASVDLFCDTFGQFGTTLLVRHGLVELEDAA